ncbi:hypothetical protein ACQP2P_16425 [Dactylosporangium sp. CA-139114]|uniref:hypothetical protein n=1 Tax=Dactylosporangium sp. CA-139114 TaxID=3239931 RepID=UPI003D9630C1
MTDAHQPTPATTVPAQADIRRVPAADAAGIKAVADVLATAFADTSLRVLVAADRAARTAALRRCFGVLAGWATMHGAVYLQDTGAGAALWLPAGQPRPFQARSGPQRASHGGNTADDAIDTALLELHAATPDAPGLNTLATVLYPSVVVREASTPPPYLLAIGVHPDARRHSVARQLIDAHHRHLDDVPATAYAIAVDPVGHRLLASAGYQLHRVDQPAAGLALQWMRRPPHGSQDGTASGDRSGTGHAPALCHRYESPPSTPTATTPRRRPQ